MELAPTGQMIPAPVTQFVTVTLPPLALVGSLAGRLNILYATSVDIGGGEAKRSDHAEERAQEGKPVGQAFQDASKATKSKVYKQVDDDRWVVRGPKSREHIFEPDGEHVTSLHRPKSAHQNKINTGQRRPITWAEWELFQEIFQ